MSWKEDYPVLLGLAKRVQKDRHYLLTTEDFLALLLSSKTKLEQIILLDWKISTIDGDRGYGNWMVGLMELIPEYREGSIEKEICETIFSAVQALPWN